MLYFHTIYLSILCSLLTGEKKKQRCLAKNVSISPDYSVYLCEWKRDFGFFMTALFCFYWYTWPIAYRQQCQCNSAGNEWIYIFLAMYEHEFDTENGVRIFIGIVCGCRFLWLSSIPSFSIRLYTYLFVVCFEFINFSISCNGMRHRSTAKVLIIFS